MSSEWKHDVLHNTCDIIGLVPRVEPVVKLNKCNKKDKETTTTINKKGDWTEQVGTQRITKQPSIPASLQHNLLFIFCLTFFFIFFNRGEMRRMRRWWHRLKISSLVAEYSSAPRSGATGSWFHLEDEHHQRQRKTRRQPKARWKPIKMAPTLLTKWKWLLVKKSETKL